MFCFCQLYEWSLCHGKGKHFLIAVRPGSQFIVQVKYSPDAAYETWKLHPLLTYFASYAYRFAQQSSTLVINRIHSSNKCLAGQKYVNLGKTLHFGSVENVSAPMLLTSSKMVYSVDHMQCTLQFHSFFSEIQNRKRLKLIISPHYSSAHVMLLHSCQRVTEQQLPTIHCNISRR